MAKGTATSFEHLTETELTALLDPDLMPRHIAVIMDGNGRWAELRGLPRMAGHTEGIKSVREIITLCRDLGIAALTIYAFSQENWKRPIPEINALMLLLEHYLSTQGLPDPDLLIRTSGEARISNFLLWQLAYTEMFFTPTLWPDFRRREALIALLEYQQRERRFGQVPGAVYPPSGL